MKNITPLEVFNNSIKNGDIQKDKNQQITIAKLDDIYDKIVRSSNVNIFKRAINTFKKDNALDIRGLYIWGDVGRGKTFLVDLFYDCLPCKKLRLHFHRFMYRIHNELKLLKGVKDPLKIVAKKLAKEASVICFDEFFVKDIADAMILANLLEELFKYKIVLVATSNIPPHLLYENGLQRGKFLNAIKLIETNLDIINIGTGIDYRMRTLTQAKIYHYPSDKVAVKNLQNTFDQLAPIAGVMGAEIDVSNRKINTIKLAEDVVWFDFGVICGQGRSANDYIEIAMCYHSVFISNVPLLNESMDDMARRFISLVDEFYDRCVKLIMTGEVRIEQLYHGQGLKFEFKRTISRLREMQTNEYLALAHKP